MLKTLDARFAAQGTKWLTGDSCTAADIWLFWFIPFFVSGFMDGVPSDAIDCLTNLLKVVRAVGGLPDVAAYYKGREDTLYGIYAKMN